MQINTRAAFESNSVLHDELIFALLSLLLLLDSMWKSCCLLWLFESENVLHDFFVALLSLLWWLLLLLLKSACKACRFLWLFDSHDVYHKKFSRCCCCCCC